MSPSSLKEMYEAYQRAKPDSMLSIEEFSEFWRGISPEDREWWMTDFLSGKTALNRDLMKIHSPEERQWTLPPAIRCQVEAMVQEDGLHMR
jgi:hypothetical protein